MTASLQRVQFHGEDHKYIGFEEFVVRLVHWRYVATVVSVYVGSHLSGTPQTIHQEGSGSRQPQSSFFHKKEGPPKHPNAIDVVLGCAGGSFSGDGDFFET